MMRCVDVILELAVPTGDSRSADLSEHLAGCARCASWAARDARLERLWEATRPPALSPAAWDRIWASVSEGIDRRAPDVAPPALAPVTPRRWRRVASWSFLAAQAAAILLAAFLLPHQGESHKPLLDTSIASIRTAAPRILRVDLEQGPVPVIRLDAPVLDVQLIAQTENPNAVDPFYSFLNKIEGNASLE